jgi:hypothetical protein
MFFPASLRFHIKACKMKQANLEVPCPHCDVEVKRASLPQHLRRCAAAKADRRARQQSMQHAPMEWGGGENGNGGGKRSGGGGDDFGSRFGSSAAGRGGGSGFGSSVVGDGRATCAICNRGFSSGRIAQHQRICRAVRRKEDSRGIFRSEGQRVTSENVVATATAPTQEETREQRRERKQRRRVDRGKLRRTIAARRAGGDQGGDFGVEIRVSPRAPARSKPQRFDYLWEM